MGDVRLRESEPEGVDHVFHLEEGQREDGRVVGNLKNIKYVIACLTTFKRKYIF
jgi:hypothetical protein